MKLALMGATTVVCGRTKRIIDGSAEQIRKAGGKAEAIACDVSDWNSVASLAQQVQQRRARIDVGQLVVGAVHGQPQGQSLSEHVPKAVTSGLGAS